MTLGKSRVRVSFNPSEQSDVATAKDLVADLIDYANSFCPETGDPEEIRLYQKAMDSFELGGMWLVKALTFKK